MSVISALLSVKRYSTVGGGFSQKGFGLGRGARSGISNCNLDRHEPSWSISGGCCVRKRLLVWFLGGGWKHF